MSHVTSGAANTLSVIDTATYTVVQSIKVGANPDAVAVSPDGTRVYVTNANANTVSMIDTATNTVVMTIPVGLKPVGVAVSPDGTRVYVTNEGSPYTVSVIAVPAITGGSAPDATVGDAYSFQISAVNMTSFAVTVGDLPDGLSLDEDAGVISGIPTAAGTVTFTVTGTGDYGQVALPYTITTNPALLTLTDIDPNEGPETGDTPVTLTGTGFTGATAVTFGDVPATDVVVVSDTQITAVSPVHDTPGTIDVVVNGADEDSAPLEFTYLNVPSITSVESTPGSETGSTDLTIHGEGFTGTTHVSVDGVAVTGHAIVSDSLITVTAPPGVTGSAAIIVHHPNGDSPHHVHVLANTHEEMLSATGPPSTIGLVLFALTLLGAGGALLAIRRRVA